MKEVVVEFKRGLDTEVRKQEKLDMTEKKNFKRRELLGKYLKKLEKN